MRSAGVTFLFLLSTLLLAAQPAEQIIKLDDYIVKWEDVAVKHMHRYGIPASITLAQGILESGYGNSPLARYANNHFGIKCNGWEGETFYQDDDEADECFRKYFDAERSYQDHAEFLDTRERYAFLFELRPTDYKGWARGLKKAGYATDPNYPRRLIRLIEDHELHRFDSISPMKSKKEKVHEGPIALDNVEVKNGRQVHEHPNGVDLIVARYGDTPRSLARTFSLSKSDLLEYNDLNPSNRIEEGDTLYIQPKRNWSRGPKTHEVKEGETMRSIAQEHALKLEKLYERNRMKPGTDPEPGQKLYLRGRAPSADGKGGFFARLFGSDRTER